MSLHRGAPRSYPGGTPPRRRSRPPTGIGS